MSEPVVRAAGLCKSYRSGNSIIGAVWEVSLVIEHGAFVAIAGRSGSGKSTLMSILGLLDRPDAGTYLLNGQETVDLHEDARASAEVAEIGFVFQLPALLPRATASENAELPLRYAGVTGAERQRRAKEADSRGPEPSSRSLAASSFPVVNSNWVAIARAIVGNRIDLADRPARPGQQDQPRDHPALFTLYREGHAILVVTHAAEVRTVRTGASRLMTARRDHPQPSRVCSSQILLRHRREFSSRVSHSVACSACEQVRTSVTVLGIIIGVAAVVCAVPLVPVPRRRYREDPHPRGEPPHRGAGRAEFEGARLEAGTRPPRPKRMRLRSDATLRPSRCRLRSCRARCKSWRETRTGQPGCRHQARLPGRRGRHSRGRAFSAEELDRAPRSQSSATSFWTSCSVDNPPLGQTLRAANVLHGDRCVDKKGQGAIGRNQDDVTPLFPCPRRKSRVLGAVRGNAGRLDFVVIKVIDAAALPGCAEQREGAVRQRHQLPEGAR